MAEFNLVFDENDNEVALIASVDASAFNGLLSDEVVMNWLMDLESQEAETERELHRAHA
jgi:hypothetical protein